METIGVEEMKRLTSEMESAVGDGTKTAAFLACEMLACAAKAEASTVSGLVRGMERAVKAALGAIESQAQPVVAQLEQIASTAAQDPVIGKVLREAFDRVGKDGIVTIEPGIGSVEPQLHVLQGLRFDRGFISDEFVNSSHTAECRLEQPLILLCDYQLKALPDVLPLLALVNRTGRPLLIVAEDVAQEVLATLLLNVRKGNLSSCAVKAPGFGDQRPERLEDFAALTGGVAFRAGSGRALTSVQLSDLGSAETAVISNSETTIIGGRGEEQIIEKRVEFIRATMSQTSDLYKKEKLQERLAQMSGGGFAIIKSGGITETESEQRIVALSKAMHACQAAIEGGWIVGGGYGNAYAANAVRELEALDSADRVAHECIVAALEAPLRYIPGMPSFPNDLLAIKDRFLQAGVFDPAPLLTRGLALAWSYARTIIQTGAWEVAPPSESAPEEPA
jgi:chaperonin GroEL